MGDCFGQLPFLDPSYDTDPRFQKSCKQLCAHNQWIRSVVIFHPKHEIEGALHEKLIVTIGDDEFLKLWNLQDGSTVGKRRLGFVMNCLLELNYKENGVDKQYFVIGGEMGRLVVYDYSADKIVKELIGSTRNILSIKILPNRMDRNSKNCLIVSGNSRGEVRFWDWQRGVTLYRIKLGIQPVQGLCVWEHEADGEEGHKGGFQMVVNSYEHKVCIWKVTGKSFRKVRQFGDHTNWVRSVVCKTVYNDKRLSNGKRESESILVSAGDDNTIRFFDIRQGSCLRIMQVHSSGIIYMEMFKNLLLSCENQGRIAITNLEDMKWYYIATGLCFDYYKGISLEHDEEKNEAYLGVVGSQPKKSSYHFLNIYKGKMVENGIRFDMTV